MEGTPPTTGPATPEETLPIGAATAVAMMPETTTSEPPEAIGTAPISTDTHSAETGPVEPPTSESDDANDEVLTVAMVDDSVALRQRARDIADDRLARETQKGGGFRGLLRRVWKGSVAEPYYSRKYNHLS